jgi:hypothetical protein
MGFESMLPRFLLVRQHFESHRIEDIPGAVRQTLEAARLDRKVKTGGRVAIGVGSRGIANIDTIVAATVAWWKDRGMQPFLFPTMGTHGAATGKGQAEVLAKYGITAAAMGCPVVSSLAVVDLGRTPEGIPVVVDRSAWSSDGVMIVGRVKWHTDFAGKIESGLFKMMAIGMGKLAGAQNYHTAAYRMGLEAVILSVGRHVLASGKMLGGLAVLEDGNHDTGHLEAVPAETMEPDEERLLALVKTWMPTIPVNALDFLIVNELGKIFSGAGMDPKVVNRSVHGAYNPWPEAPVIERIFLRDLHPMSYGNAVGYGMADVIHRRLLRKVKRKPTYVNSITSNTLACIRTPIHFASDRECLERTWRTAGRMDPCDLRIGWIRNSQDLTVMAFTENLREELEQRQGIEVVGEARRLEFDERGDLVDWLGPSRVVH